MKYRDPMPVKCPHCGETREYPVKDLQNFRAICSACNHDLNAISKIMREKAAYISDMIVVLGLLSELEEKLGVEFEDRELWNLKTLDDVYRLTLTKATPHFSEDQMKETILAVASELGKYSVQQVDLGMDLLDVLET